MLKIKIEQIGKDKVVDMLRKIKRDMPQISRMLLQRFAEEIIKTAIVKYLSGTLGDKSVLHRRSGRLANSIRYWFSGGSCYVGTNIIYAAIHEYGGIIRAVNAKYLRFKIQERWYSKKQVRIPKRAYIKPSIDDFFKDTRARRIAEITLKQEIEKRMVA
jgi:phage gpG-like protein